MQLFGFGRFLKFLRRHTFFRLTDKSQHVENNYNATSNVLSMNDDMIFNVMDIFDISFDVEDVVDLDALLSDIGSSLADIDPLVLDTE